MKLFNLLRKPETWFFLSIILAVTIIIMAVVWSRHECPKPSIEKLEHKLEVLQLKQKRYEEIITNDSIIIWNSDRKYRDSIRAIRFGNYLH